MKNTLTGLLTTEFWLTSLAGTAAMFLPDLPTESLYALGAWVIARGAQKGFGVTDKRAWLTTEFWLALGTSALLYIFPDFPKESLIGLIGYIGSRFFAKKR